MNGRPRTGPLDYIWLIIIFGLLAIPVGKGFAIPDKWEEKPVPPTYLEPMP